MSITSQENAPAVLTEREQQAIDNINAVLAGDGSDPESGPGAWGDCGEVDVPVLLDAVHRLSKIVAEATSASDTTLNELEELELQATPAPWTAWEGNGKIFYGQPEVNKPGHYSPANIQLFTADDFDREDEEMDVQPGMAEDDARFVAALRNAYPSLRARLQKAEARAYPETLTPELDEVLGWPNFKCAGFASAFRAAGHDIGRKAEREQAFVLHWLTGLVLKHGAGWQDAASSELAALREKIAVKGEQPND